MEPAAVTPAVEFFYLALREMADVSTARLKPLRGNVRRGAEIARKLRYWCRVAGWLSEPQNHQWLDFGNGIQILSPALLKLMTTNAKRANVLDP